MYPETSTLIGNGINYLAVNQWLFHIERGEDIHYLILVAETMKETRRNIP